MAGLSIRTRYGKFGGHPPARVGSGRLPVRAYAGGANLTFGTRERSPYSLRILSAHSTSATRLGGVTNRAFLFLRSSSRTTRAREQAVQTWIGMLWAMVLGMISD